MVARGRGQRRQYSVSWYPSAMRIAVVLALAAVLGSCTFAVRHPAITSGIVGAVIGGGTCELAIHNTSGASGRSGTCALVGGAAGLGLGLIVAAAIYFGGEGHTILVEEPQPELLPVHEFKHADAGIEVDAAIDVAPVDAGM